MLHWVPSAKILHTEAISGRPDSMHMLTAQAPSAGALNHLASLQPHFSEIFQWFLNRSSLPFSCASLCFCLLSDWDTHPIAQTGLVTHSVTQVDLKLTITLSYWVLRLQAWGNSYNQSWWSNSSQHSEGRATFQCIVWIKLLKKPFDSQFLLKFSPVPGPFGR